MHPSGDDRPVVVVGGGPTGVTAALALATRGIEVVVLERHEDVWALPRAVHLDDEVARLLQGLGVGEAFAGITRPARGLRLLDREHRTLAEFARSPLPGPHGHPQANLFDQPELERLLRARLAELPRAVLRTGVEVVRVEAGPRGAVVVVQDVATGAEQRLAASAVLGCDGADSTVRAAVGARWRELAAGERWLVLDVRCPVPLGAWAGVHQVCDGRRAATFLQVGEDRYRWEFQLRDGERTTDLERPEVLADLVRPWTGAVPFARLAVLRSAEYVFRARVVDRWRLGRVFLLGDAAHQTPPFVGQGLGAGLRDAGNLGWKLAAVLQGRAPEALLDSYQAERLPHARAMVRLAVTAGWAMTGGRGRSAAVRRGVLAALCRVPGAQAHLLDRGSPALVRGPLVRRSRRRGQRMAGALAPQPRVRVPGRPGEVPDEVLDEVLLDEVLLGEVLLDEVLGDGFAVLVRTTPDPGLLRLAARLDAPVLRIGTGPGALRDDGTLERWLAGGRASTALLRPDRTVLVTARSPVAPGAELEREHADVLRLVGADTPPAAVTASGRPAAPGPTRRRRARRP